MHTVQTDITIINPMIEKQDFGIQPLDELMTKLAISNHDLVAASKEQLTHKMVQKGRKGRRLTLNAQHKILYALKSLKPEPVLTRKDLFSYDPQTSKNKSSEKE